MRHRVGLMGGTFDPVHNGHLMAAELVRHHYGLDYVVFIPAAQSPLKKEEPSDGRHRYVMLCLATVGNPFFRVSPYELDRDKPSYTIRTIRAFREMMPGAELVFITGVDAALQLPLWKSPEELLSLARFVAVSRSGFPRAELSKVIERFPEEMRRNFEVLETPMLPISASEIRERVRAGLPIRYLVPEQVADYIRKEGLYLT